MVTETERLIEQRVKVRDLIQQMHWAIENNMSIAFIHELAWKFVNETREEEV